MNSDRRLTCWPCLWFLLLLLDVCLLFLLVVGIILEPMRRVCVLLLDFITVSTSICIIHCLPLDFDAMIQCVHCAIGVAVICVNFLLVTQARDLSIE